MAADAGVGDNNQSKRMSTEEIMSKYARGENDTGSPEVQIALLTDKIQHLSKHFKDHHGDKHSLRGMLQMVSRRNGLLKYLKRKDIMRYRALIGSLGLRK